MDPEGNPVAQASCECGSEKTTREDWFSFVQTDSHGRFVVDNCREKGVIRVYVRAGGFEALLEIGIDPRVRDLELKLKRRAPGTVHIVGTVIGPDALPASNVRVSASRVGHRGAGGLKQTGNDGHFELGPYAPGIWRVYLQSRGHPMYVSEVRDLKANATWDLGTITLQRGGTAVVRQLGPVDAEPRFMILDGALKDIGENREVDRRLQSRVRLPGNYLLLVGGEGVAAKSVPFAIVAGEETIVDVKMQNGIAQVFTVVRSDGEKFKSLALDVKCNGTLISRVWTRTDGVRLTGEAWLAPGSYTVSASVGKLAGSTSFTVNAVPSMPVTVLLR